MLQVSTGIGGGRSPALFFLNLDFWAILTSCYVRIGSWCRAPALAVCCGVLPTLRLFALPLAVMTIRSLCSYIAGNDSMPSGSPLELHERIRMCLAPCCCLMSAAESAAALDAGVSH